MEIKEKNKVAQKIDNNTLVASEKLPNRDEYEKIDGGEVQLVGQLNDELTFRDAKGNLIKMDMSKRSRGCKFDTQVTAYNELGEVQFDDHNELLLSGGLFTLAKIANVNMPITIQTLNQDLNIEAGETPPTEPGPRKIDHIFGFIIGIGGCTDTFDTVKPVLYKERKVDSLIPFRKVKKDVGLDVDERSKYYMKKSNGDTWEYFIKKFESTAVILAEYDKAGNPPVPANVDETPGNEPMNTYLKFILKVSNKDIREFFEQRGGGLRKARVNTLGLVTGYYDNSGEYKGVRVFSKINFNNEPFDNETKELTIVYKIFI